MASTRSIRAIRSLSAAVVLGVSVLLLVGCGAGRSGARSQVTHASWVSPPSSFADVRAISTAVIEGVAGAQVDDVVPAGPAEGMSFTRTPFTVTKVLSGNVSQSVLTVARLPIAELHDAPLVEGQRYLLFLGPANLVKGSDDYGVSWGVSYRLSGDVYTYHGAFVGAGIPAELPVATAEQQVVARVVRPSGSLAYRVKSFAQARQLSTAIVEGVAGEATKDSIRTGPLAGAPVALTRFTITKVMWGKLESSSVTLSALCASEGASVAEAQDHPLLAGQRYLLFLTPANPDPGPDKYSVTVTIGYVLEGDTYVYNGGPDDADVPAKLPVGTAEQQVVS